MEEFEVFEISCWGSPSQGLQRYLRQKYYLPNFYTPDELFWVSPCVLGV